MRSTLALLLLFGPAIGAATPCELYKLPATGECTIEIEWRVHNDKQALATCLEYFPTTFVTGVQSGKKVKCTVSAAYKCVKDGHFLLYDKCYYFSPTANAINKKKFSEYAKMDATTKRSEQCAGGKLAAVYSSTHAKFLGMAANKIGIEKLGIGMTTDGMTIDEENGKKSMLHKKMWKLVEGDYWNGDKLVKAPVNDNKEPVYPPEANYLFMRTKTDHMYNRIQGSFERATKDVEVTFACEVPAVFTEHQQWYCDKLGEKGLGLDTVYDDKAAAPRCLYLTASKYTFTGDFADTKNIKGCQERPSDLHSAGMDDGTGTAAKYTQFTFKGKKRLAVARAEKISEFGADHKQIDCQGKETDSDKMENYKRQFLYFDHHGKKQFAASTQIPWEPEYPLKECSDFPKTSIGATAGLRTGLIDMAKEVPARAVCSLRFFQECENRLAKTGESPCGKKMICRNAKEYNTNTKAPVIKEGFFTCACPGHGAMEAQGAPYVEEVDPQTGVTNCKWNGPQDEDSKIHCAWLQFYRHPNKVEAWEHERYFMIEDSGTDHIDRNFIDGAYGGRFGDHDIDTYNDKLQRVVVKEGCTLRVNSKKRSVRAARKPLTPELGYGDHPVPNTWDGSLGGDGQGWGASSAHCCCNGVCKEDKP